MKSFHFYALLLFGLFVVFLSSFLLVPATAVACGLETANPPFPAKAVALGAAPATPPGPAKAIAPGEACAVLGSDNLSSGEEAE